MGSSPKRIIGPKPYARLLAPYRGDMGCVHPNHRGKPLRYVIKPLTGAIWGVCTPTVGASPYAILLNPDGVKTILHLTSSIFPLPSYILHHPSYMLPQEFFDVPTEGGFLSPAVVFESLADVALDIGRKGTSAVVVFVVALAGIDMNKVVLDGTLDTARHVVIHGGESDGHADGLVIAEPRTTLTLHLRIVKVHALHEHPILRRISTEDTMKTVFTKWTHSTIAN